MDATPLLYAVIIVAVAVAVYYVARKSRSKHHMTHHNPANKSHFDGDVPPVLAPDIRSLRAARGAVDAMTSQLRELRAERVVGDDLDAATLQRLGLEPPRTRVEFRRGTIEPIVLRLGEACEGHDGEVAAMQQRVMQLLEKEVAAGRQLPRRAAAFLDRFRQQLRRRPRPVEE